MTFIKIGAVMVFSKDDAEGSAVFPDIAAYNKFLICHPFEFDPVFCAPAGIIQAGGFFGNDTFQFLLSGGAEQSEAIRGDIALDGDKAVLADG